MPTSRDTDGETVSQKETTELESRASQSSIPRFASFTPKAATKGHAGEVVEEKRHRRRPHAWRQERKHEQQDDRELSDEAGLSRQVKAKKRSSHDSRAAQSRSEDDREHQHVQSRTTDVSYGLVKYATHHEYNYQIDRKGDLQNLQYGRLHRYSIPKYRRLGSGFILGLARSARIERTDEDTLMVVRTRHATADRPDYNSKKWTESRAQRFVQPDNLAQSFDYDVDFISVIGPSKRRKLEWDLPKSDPERHSKLLLDSPTRQADQISDSDIEYATDSSADQASSEYDRKTISENARLTRSTVTDPTSVQSWLDLIEHQLPMLFIGRGARSQALTPQNKRALADVRSTIYEKAIKAVPSGDARVQLIIKHMDEIAPFWESKRLEDRWQMLLDQNPQSVDLWLDYLAFLQTNLTKYRFESCRTLYLKCLGMLSHAISMRSTEHWEIQCLHDSFVHIFTRFTVMLREAGYGELAIALWQAILEFVIFRPASLMSAQRSECLASFEEYWESEVPRVGEPGAQGWSRYGENSTPPAPDLRDCQRSTSGVSFSNLAQTETQLQALLKLPGRTADELGADDPYHIVLFSDISTALAAAPSDIPSSKLVLGYLRFAGLPSFDSEAKDLVDTLSLDPFLQYQTSIPLTGDTANFTSAHITPTTATLFNESFGGCILEETEWAHRTLGLLSQALPENAELAEYHLALALHAQRVGQGSVSAAKSAKLLLKAQPHNLRLYNAYGIIEARNGKSSFHNVFATALSVSESFPEDGQRDRILLWRTWVWETLRTGALDFARQILHSIDVANTALPSISAVKPSTETTLRASKTLAETRDQAIFRHDVQHAVMATECLALLRYLQIDGEGLEAALVVYEQAEVNLPHHDSTATAAREALHQARAGLIIWHVEHAQTYRPADIREALAKSIKLFPDNTLLLAHFAAGEERFRIDDRVRTAITEVMDSKGGKLRSTIVTHYFAIATELQRTRSHTGTKHSVRAAFERAVDSRVGAYCPALWQAYLQYELSEAEPDMKQAREVFFKGMTKLPWCKAFMLMAFHEKMRANMSEDELIRVYRLMEEKELRLFARLPDL